ncbi:MAG: hypothetical protein CL569_11690 [Alphaproteobacteria bacterium]|nr:hypothetical protein [Alphaproteobacteria bacterium]
MNYPLAYALSVWWRNATLYARTWRVTLLPNFFEPVFYLTAIGVGVGAYITEMGGTLYIQFLAPGLLCVSAMHGSSYEVTFNTFIRITFEKAYDPMLTTPINTGDILIGEVLWAMTCGCTTPIRFSTSSRFPSRLRLPVAGSSVANMPACSPLSAFR